MINKEHKDRLFSFLFGCEANKEWTLSLYNAVNGTNYTDPEEIEITTISDAIYMGMRNDVSFLLRCYMNLYEQQSTYNPNMPVRELMYLGKLYDKYIYFHRLNIYGRKLLQLPIPRLVMFYNGEEDHGDEVLRLSDAFPKGLDVSSSDVEVRVRMLNINYGHNRELMEACKPLSEYAWFVEEIRENRKDMGIEEAIDMAIDNVPENFEIRRFLVGNRAEVKDMCMTEYNEAETMQMFKEEGEDRLGELIEQLLAKGRLSDVQRAATDKAARAELYKEFGMV